FGLAQHKCYCSDQLAELSHASTKSDFEWKGNPSKSNFEETTLGEAAANPRPLIWPRSPICRLLLKPHCGKAQRLTGPHNPMQTNHIGRGRAGIFAIASLLDSATASASPASNAYQRSDAPACRPSRTPGTPYANVIVILIG